MSPPLPPARPPVHVSTRTAVRALNGLGNLLNCADPARWNSMARPQAAEIGCLLWLIADHIQPPPTSESFGDDDGLT